MGILFYYYKSYYKLQETSEVLFNIYYLLFVKTTSIEGKGGGYNLSQPQEKLFYLIQIFEYLKKK